MSETTATSSTTRRSDVSDASKKSSAITAATSPASTTPVRRRTERSIEARFVKLMQQKGYEIRKFVSPGRRGSPDRLVLLPKGRCAFVELKAPGEEPTKLQRHV